MLILDIKRPSSYSRITILIRLFFGIFYVLIPTLFCFFILEFVSLIIRILNFFSIMIYGKNIEPFFEFYVDYYNWKLRFLVYCVNLTNNYPTLGLRRNLKFNSKITLIHETKPSQILTFVQFFCGFVLVLPQLISFLLVFIFVFFAFWVSFFSILFTNKYPTRLIELVNSVFNLYFRAETFFDLITTKSYIIAT